jgi:hypothetical protein
VFVLMSHLLSVVCYYGRSNMCTGPILTGYIQSSVLIKTESNKTTIIYKFCRIKTVVLN